MKLLHLKPIIFNWGCPRSGTTFIEEAFSYLPIHTQKIHEGNPLHPCKSDNGLITLQDLYRNRQVLFIRTFRNPIEIFESFRAMDGSVGKQNNEKIFDFIRTEYENYHKQKNKISCVEIDFDLLGTGGAEYRVERSHTIDARIGISDKKILNCLNKHGYNPIRKGRLSMGITKSLLTEKEKEEINNFAETLK